MTILSLQSFSAGKWIGPSGSPRKLKSAVTGDTIAELGSSGLDFAAMADHARTVGGRALRAITFHERAAKLKALAQYLNERREPLYELSYDTGATKLDSMIDIDGGIGTMFVYASKGRRECPTMSSMSMARLNMLGKTGTFLGQHVCNSLLRASPSTSTPSTSPSGACWRSWRRPCLPAMPAIVKPATATGVADRSLLPDDARERHPARGRAAAGRRRHRAICWTGSADRTLSAFTGSAATASMLRGNRNIIENSVRFVAEQDSLNASILGPDVTPGSAGIRHLRQGGACAR